MLNLKQLHLGLDLVISTPGRLIDLVSKAFLSLDTVTTLIIDEFDKMLDSTFWPQLNFINSLLPSPNICQRALFSASFASKVRPYVDQIFNHTNTEKLFEMIKCCEETVGYKRQIDQYSLLILGNLNEVRKEVEEKFIFIKSEIEKEHWLVSKIRALVVQGKIIIFVNSKKRAVKVQEIIEKNLHLKVPCIYGDMFTLERHKILKAFREESDVLISTDVLGRGIDVKEVK
jgi:superfamily II DNA/RNA helicase